MTYEIYRLESPDGNGVYRGSVEIYDCDHYKVHENLTEVHQAPQNDLVFGDWWACLDYMDQQDWYFGFVSIEQLLQWFHQPEWRRWLAAKKVKLVCYHISKKHVKFGERQVAFLRDRAVRKEYLGRDRWV